MLISRQLTFCPQKSDENRTTVVVDELPADADPLRAGWLHGSDLKLWVGYHLLEHLFLLSSLDVELAVKHLRYSERTHTRLVAIPVAI